MYGALHSKYNVVGFCQPITAAEACDMVANEKFTYEDIAEVLSYNPDTGEFRWKATLNSRAKAGGVAGAIQRMQNGKDYLSITYQGVKISAAPLAWLLFYKEWPDRSVFYDDADTTNLRISNLKLAAHKSNKIVGDDGKVKYKMSQEQVRHYGLQRNYGISYTDYAKMYAEQGGVCAICHKAETARIPGRKTSEPQAETRDLSVDHDHVTGAIRGLLCNGCNHMLGEVNDNRETLLSAVAYLDKHSGLEQPKTTLTLVKES